MQVHTYWGTHRTFGTTLSSRLLQACKRGGSSDPSIPVVPVARFVESFRTADGIHMFKCEEHTPHTTVVMRRIVPVAATYSAGTFGWRILMAAL